MKEEPTAELFPLEDCPAASRDPVAFVRSVEGEFDCRSTVALNDAIVEVRLHCQQSERAEPVRFQGQVRGLQEIQIVEIPQFRVDNSPHTNEQAFGR